MNGEAVRVEREVQGNISERDVTVTCEVSCCLEMCKDEDGGA